MNKNGNIKIQWSEDIPFRRELLSKHSQLMRMYILHNNMKMAKEQFEILKPNFNFLNNKGEFMYFYTIEDFKQDLKRFEKMSI